MSKVALNMIVKGGEADLLSRCLTSFMASENFDEIVIVNTSTDSDIDNVARAHGGCVLHFEWVTPDHPYGHFGDARNCALMNTASEYVMWLDTDDLLSRDHAEAFKSLLSTIRDDANKHVDVYLAPYIMSMDLDGHPTSVFTRERIFKTKVFTWQGACHELLTPEWQTTTSANCNKVAIIHGSHKSPQESAARNLTILRHEIEDGNDDIQIRYFFARDNLLVGDIDTALKYFSQIIDNFESSYAMLYAMSIDLVRYYAYGKYMKPGSIGIVDIENKTKIEKYARLALAFDDTSSEAYCILGDLYNARGVVDGAERVYHKAIRKADGNALSKFTLVPFTHEIPYARLASIYTEQGRLDQALLCNKNALMSSKNSKEYIGLRKYLLGELVKEFELNYTL